MTDNGNPVPPEANKPASAAEPAMADALAAILSEPMHVRTIRMADDRTLTYYDFGPTVPAVSSREA